MAASIALAQRFFGSTCWRVSRLVLRNALPEPRGKPETAAHTGCALAPCRAAHQLSQAPGDGQPKAGAAVLARHGVVSLFEGIEEPGHGLGCNSNPRVLHFKAQQRRAVVFLLGVDLQHDVAMTRELDGVVGVIEQGLLQPSRVTQKMGRQVREFDEQAQALGLDGCGQNRNHIAQHVTDGDGHFFQHKLAGLDLGEVQDVVDDAQQVSGRRVNLVQSVGLLGRYTFEAKEVGHAKDAVHGGADFVAHVGQEGALGDVGRFSLELGLDQKLIDGFNIGGALVNPFFEMSV